MAEETLPSPNPFDEPRVVTDPEELFETYKTQIFAGAALLVLVVVGAIAWWFWKQGQEATAMQEYQQATSVEAWETVAQDWANTSAGGFALLEIARSYKEAGDWEDAAAAFSRFLQYHPRSPLAPTAAYGQARAMEAMENWDAAGDAYQDILADANNAFSMPASIGLARIYLATEQPEAARQTLADLIATASQSNYIREAEAMLKKIP